MTARDVSRVIVCNFGLALVIPQQNFERQIDASGGLLFDQPRPRLRIAEDEQNGWGKMKTDTLGVCLMINPRGNL